MRRVAGLPLLLVIAAGLLAACGETAAPNPNAEPPPTAASVGGLPVPPANGTATPTAVATPSPIPRQARFEYPKQMQVNKPAKVQFSLFVTGAAPATLPEVITDTRGLPVPAPPPGLTPYVSVRLIPTGAEVTKEENKEPEELRDDFNLWRWEITAPEAQTVDLRLQIHVAYCASEGQDCRDGRNLVWQPPPGGNTIPVLPDNPLLVLLKQAETSLGAAVGVLTGFLSLISTCVGIMVGSISILKDRKEIASGSRS